MVKQEKSKTAPAAAAAPQRARPAPAGGNPENAKRLVAIETNKLMIAALRDVHELVSGKIKEARDQIEQLKKEREGGKSFASYRKLSALRNVRTELSKLSASLREQMTAKAGAQKAAASQAQGGQ
jgi:3-oxoacyl-ACP reductase-like protein